MSDRWLISAKLIIGQENGQKSRRRIKKKRRGGEREKDYKIISAKPGMPSFSNSACASYKRKKNRDPIIVTISVVQGTLGTRTSSLPPSLSVARCVLYFHVTFSNVFFTSCFCWGNSFGNEIASGCSVGYRTSIKQLHLIIYNNIITIDGGNVLLLEND